jgi:hypothetical protein
VQGLLEFLKSLGAALIAAMAAVTVALVGFFASLILRLTAPTAAAGLWWQRRTHSGARQRWTAQTAREELDKTTHACGFGATSWCWPRRHRASDCRIERTTTARSSTAPPLGNSPTSARRDHDEIINVERN